MELTHQLTPMLRTLRLSGILETLEVRNRQAVEQQSSFVEFLTTLLHDEVERRAQSKLRMRLRRAASIGWRLLSCGCVRNSTTGRRAKSSGR